VATDSIPTSADPEVKNVSQTDHVLYSIKKMIIDGSLKAGSRLPIEKDLAKQLGTSRGSLREGVRALCIMGVLETRQGDGTYVTSLDPATLLAPMAFVIDLHSPTNTGHLQTVRRILESEAAANAALRIDAADIDRAAAVLDSIERYVSGETEMNYGAVMEADIAFHRIIAKSSGNPALEALIEALASRTVRSRTWRAISDKGAVANAHREHRAILADLRARNPERAHLRMANHLLDVEDFIYAHPTEISDEQ
jgi:GntR family transcriptional repressor for pyruvate dehydrogenase complex